MTRSPLRVLAAAGVVLAGSVAAVVASAPAAHAEVICEPFGTRPIQNGRYVVQNNRWGATTPQCIDVTDTGFTDHRRPTTTTRPTARPPRTRRSTWAATTPTARPAATCRCRSARSAARPAASATRTRGGTYNASYDIWLDPTPADRRPERAPRS